jgi:hypothetical protein
LIANFTFWLNFILIVAYYLQAKTPVSTATNVIPAPFKVIAGQASEYFQQVHSEDRCVNHYLKNHILYIDVFSIIINNSNQF